MPSQTERSLLTDILLESILVEQALDVFAESEVLSSDSETDSDSDDSFIMPVQTHVDPLIKMLTSLHSRRYFNERTSIPKTQQNIHMLLNIWKVENPQIFRRYVRVNPSTFDRLFDVIKDNPIFQNNSITSPQTPVEIQLAVCLYRFGHYGNAASVEKVALWAGFGYGTVDLFTTRVMIALCQDNFRKSAI